MGCPGHWFHLIGSMNTPLNFIVSFCNLDWFERPPAVLWAHRNRFTFARRVSAYDGSEIVVDGYRCIVFHQFHGDEGVGLMGME